MQQQQYNHTAFRPVAPPAQVAPSLNAEGSDARFPGVPSDDFIYYPARGFFAIPANSPPVNAGYYNIIVDPGSLLFNHNEQLRSMAMPAAPYMAQHPMAAQNDAIVQFNESLKMTREQIEQLRQENIELNKRISALEAKLLPRADAMSTNSTNHPRSALSARGSHMGHYTYTRATIVEQQAQTHHAAAPAHVASANDTAVEDGNF